MKTKNRFGHKIAYDCMFVWTTSEISAGKARGEDGKSQSERKIKIKSKRNNCRYYAVVTYVGKRKGKGVFIFPQSVQPGHFL